MTRTIGIAMFVGAGCTALLFAVDADETFPVRGGLQRIDQPETAPGLTMGEVHPGGVWQSEYDHNLDGTLTSAETASISISVANGHLIGNYAEHQAVGKPNDSVFSGRFIDGTPPVVTLRQDDEPGYTAVYTGRLVAPNRFFGTYFDNRGFSGDWSLSLETGDDAVSPLETIEVIERSTD